MYQNALFLSCLFIFACGTSNSSISSSDEHEIVFSNEKISKKTGKCETPDGPCCEADISYIKAIKGNQIVLDSINSTILSTISNALAPEGHAIPDIEKNVALFLQSYEETLIEIPEYPMPWSVDISFESLFQNEKFITLAYSDYQFTGGAHPNGSLLYFVFDKLTGKKLSSKDLFSNAEKLNAIAEENFRKQNAIAPSSPLSESDFTFPNDKFTINGNIGITKDTLIIFYNSYEIASYAQGPIELRLPLNQIKDILVSKYFK
jgi:Deacetylase PdaC/Protein of unknown function (DUF3298)